MKTQTSEGKRHPGKAYGPNGKFMGDLMWVRYVPRCPCGFMNNKEDTTKICCPRCGSEVSFIICDKGNP